MNQLLEEIDKFEYPVEILRIVLLATKQECDPEPFTLLVSQNNFEFLVSKFEKQVTSHAESLAKQATDSSLAIEGIPNISNSVLKKIEKFSNNEYFVEPLSLEKVKEKLEEKFYNSFIKLLLKKKVNFAFQVNKILDEFEADANRHREYSINPVFGAVYQNYIQQILEINIKNISKSIPHFTNLLSEISQKVSEKSYENYIKIRLKIIKHLVYTNEESQRFINIGYLLIQSYSDFYNLFASIFWGFGETEINQVEWERLSTEEKIDTYIICYLFLSRDIFYFRRVESLLFLTETHEFFSPEARQYMRELSKKYPIFEVSEWSKSSFEIFKLIDNVVSSKLNKRKNSLFQTRVEYREVHQLKKLNNVVSNHIIICISGYLSQDDNHKKTWNNLVKLHPNVSIYSFIWESSDRYSLISQIPGLIRFKKALSNHFLDNCSNAEVAGVCLANMVENNFNTVNSTCISLVGFSLGTLVITHCLNRLRYSNVKMFHDVIFIGSATSITEAEDMAVFKVQLVAGKLVNVYSKNDVMLKVFYRYAKGTSACGTREVEGMENVDVSGIINGHNEYRKKLVQVLKKIPDFI